MSWFVAKAGNGIISSPVTVVMSFSRSDPPAEVLHKSMMQNSTASQLFTLKGQLPQHHARGLVYLTCLWHCLGRKWHGESRLPGWWKTAWKNAVQWLTKKTGDWHGSSILFIMYARKHGRTTRLFLSFSWGGKSWSFRASRLVFLSRLMLIFVMWGIRCEWHSWFFF